MAEDIKFTLRAADDFSKTLSKAAFGFEQIGRKIAQAEVKARNFSGVLGTGVLGKDIARFGREISKIGSAIAGLTGPVGAIISLLPEAIKAIERFSVAGLGIRKFKELFENISSGVSTAQSSIKRLASTLFDLGKGVFVASIKNIGSAITGLGRAALGVVLSPLKALGGALGRIFEIATGILVAGVFRKIAGGLRELGSIALDAVSTFQGLRIRLENLVAIDIQKQFAKDNTITETFNATLSLTSEQTAKLTKLQEDLRHKSELLRAKQADIGEITDQNSGSYIRAAEQIRRYENDIASLQGQIGGLQSIEGQVVQKTREVVTGTLDFGTAMRQAVGPAQELLQWVQRIAVTTPFEVEDLSRTLSMAIAFGQSVEGAKQLTLAVGNFTSGMGLGSDVMDRILINFGQMRQQSRVTQRELTDLGRGALVPVNDVLKEMGSASEEFITGLKNVGQVDAARALEDLAGKGTEAVRKFLQTSRDPAFVEAFEQTFIKLVSERFPDGMERMAKTLEGVRSNIRDFIGAVLGASVLGPIFDRIADSGANLINDLMTEENLERFRRFGEFLGETFDLIKSRVGAEIVPKLESLGINLARILGLEAPQIDEESITSFINNVITKIGEVITTVGGGALPWVQLFVKSMEEGDFTPFIDAVRKKVWDEGLSPWISSQVEVLVTKFKEEWVPAFSAWLGSAEIVQIVNTLGTNLGMLAGGLAAALANQLSIAFGGGGEVENQFEGALVSLTGGGRQQGLGEVIFGLGKVLVVSFARGFTDGLGDAFEMLKDGIKAKIVEKVQSIVNEIDWSQVVFRVALQLGDIATPGGGLGEIVGLAENLGAALGALTSIQLPEWLKPGSPPPLAMAISDIARAAIEELIPALGLGEDGLTGLLNILALEVVPTLSESMTGFMDETLERFRVMLGGEEQSIRWALTEVRDLLLVVGPSIETNLVAPLNRASAAMQSLVGATGQFLDFVTVLWRLGLIGPQGGGAPDVGLPEGFQHGGIIGRGQMGLVGERGPEFIRPLGTSVITPNDQLRGGGGGITIQNLNVAMHGVNNPRQMLDQIVVEARNQGMRLAPVS